MLRCRRIAIPPLGQVGFVAIGAAVRHERCGLKEIVVSTHVKESKSGSRKTVATTEHNSIKVDEVRS